MKDTICHWNESARVNQATSILMTRCSIVPSIVLPPSLFLEKTVQSGFLRIREHSLMTRPQFTQSIIHREESVSGCSLFNYTPRDQSAAYRN